MGTTVLTVGEALISLTPIGGSSLQDAEQLYVSAAGAELNVAVHLARLGVPTRLASSVGDDPMGRRLRASLGRAGVDTTFLEADPVRHTAVYLKDPQAATAAVYYYRAGSAASAYREVPAAAWADVEHVHLEWDHAGPLGGVPEVGRLAAQPTRGPDLVRCQLPCRTVAAETGRSCAAWTGEPCVHRVRRLGRGGSRLGHDDARRRSTVVARARRG